MSEDVTELKALLRAAESSSKTAERALLQMKRKRLPLVAWSAIAGFLLFAIGGQWFPGYQLDSTAMAAAEERANAAIGDVMAQLCAERFMRTSGLEGRLADLDSKPSDWGKSQFIREGKWAAMPQGGQPNQSTARRCQELIVERVAESSAQTS